MDKGKKTYILKRIKTYPNCNALTYLLLYAVCLSYTCTSYANFSLGIKYLILPQPEIKITHFGAHVLLKLFLGFLYRVVLPLCGRNSAL